MGHTTKYRNREGRIALLKRLQRGDRVERRKHRRDELRREQAEAEFMAGLQWTPDQLQMDEGQQA